jgi:hypothetical protein
MGETYRDRLSIAAMVMIIGRLQQLIRSEKLFLNIITDSRRDQAAYF